MTRTIRDRFFCGLIALICATVCLPEAAFGQGGDGFLFKRPRVTLKFESGYGFQRAQSDIYDFVIDKHFIERRDFDSPYLGGEFSVRVSERLDLGVSVGYLSSSILAESRHFEGTDDLPIESVTELRQIPVTFNARYFLADRGRSLGRFAWVPENIAPFVSAGAGVVGYRFDQVGEFVDEQTLDIFYDRFNTDRSTFLARAGAGVNVSLNKQFIFSAEARYSWARGELSSDFVGFDKIDLDGFQLVGGIAVRF